MGEPLEEINVDEIYSGLDNIRHAEEEFEKGIRDLKKFQDKVSDLSVSSGLNNGSEAVFIQNNTNFSQGGGATGQDLLNVYEETIVDEDDDLDQIKRIEEDYGFSKTASHLFYHVTRDKGQSREDAKHFAAYLDKDAPISKQHVNQAIYYSKSLIQVREKTFRELEKEKSSLKFFQSKVEDIKNKVTKLNKENPFPLNFKELYSTTKELDKAYLELENLKQLRQLENDYLDQIKDIDYRSNMHNIYGKEDGDPVIDEIKSIQEIMQEATISGINYPLKLEGYKQNTYEICNSE